MSKSMINGIQTHFFVLIYNGLMSKSMILTLNSTLPAFYKERIYPKRRKRKESRGPRICPIQFFRCRRLRHFCFFFISRRQGLTSYCLARTGSLVLGFVFPHGRAGAQQMYRLTTWKPTLMHNTRHAICHHILQLTLLYLLLKSFMHSPPATLTAITCTYFTPVAIQEDTRTHLSEHTPYRHTHAHINTRKPKTE